MGGVDTDYIIEQRGFINLPQALVGKTRNVRPALVVLFVTKFDLFSARPPYDTASDVARADIVARFEEHREALALQCQRSNIPFEYIIGSAKCGWGVRDLRDSVTRKVLSRA